VDPFSEGSARDEPFRPLDYLSHDDSKTFTTSTSGIPAIDPSVPFPGWDTTEAQLLANNYRQQNVTPIPSTGERLSVIHSEGRSPSPSILESPYRDNNPHSPTHLMSVTGKTDEASLVPNAADMGRTVHFQDLGMH